MSDVELILAQETIDRQADEITRLRADMEAFSDAANEANARAKAAEAEQDRLKELNAALRFGRDQSQDQATAFFNRAEAAEAERDRLREEVMCLKEVMRGAGCPKTITAYRTV